MIQIDMIAIIIVVQILNEIKSVRSLCINTFLVLQMSIERAHSFQFLSVSVRLMLSMISGQCHFARTSETSDELHIRIVSGASSELDVRNRGRIYCHDFIISFNCLHDCLTDTTLPQYTLSLLSSLFIFVIF